MIVTLEFIEKRIAEQREYIEGVMRKQQDGKMSMDRSLELIGSAMGILQYFEKKLSSYKKPASDILEEVDELLARLEDFTKGDDGKDITRIRGKINDYLYKK